MSQTWGRLQWIDVAKGLAIALVVVHHALEFLDAYGWPIGVMQRADTALTSLRMPLFFAVSGLLAANAIATLSLRALWTRRMLLLVYLYVLWGVVRAVWFTFVPWPLGDLDPWMQLLLSPIQPWSGLWYLYALALYLALAWLMRSLPAWAQLAVGGAVSVGFASGLLQLGTGYTWRSIGTYFFFFLLGLHGRRLLLRWAERVGWTTGILAVVVYGALAVGVAFIPSPVQWVGRLPVAVLGVFAGTALAVLLCRLAWVGRAGARLGVLTLPVYVVHVLVISALVPLLPVGIVPTPFAVLAVAVLAIAVSLGIHFALRRVPGVFTLPPVLAPSVRASG